MRHARAIATPAARPRAARRAFTVTELLIVVVIIAAAAVLVLPAVSQIVSSTSYTAALNQVSAALGNARARAIATNNTTALVFLFDIETERYTLQIVELDQGGASLTARAGGARNDSYARAFRPAAGIGPVELPAGIGVYGLSFSVSPQRDANGDIVLSEDIDNDTAAWYAGERLPLSGGREEVPWLFPRNDPLLYIAEPEATKDELWSGDLDSGASEDAVRHAQSFMVMFDETGRVISVSLEGGIANPNAFLEFPNAPLDLSEAPEDRKPVDGGTLFDPEVGLDRDVEPNPEVVLRAVQQLAIVDLNRLRSDLGDRIFDTPPWLFRGDGSPSQMPQGRMTESDEIVADISAWVDNNAEVIGFNTYTGAIIKRSAP